MTKEELEKEAEEYLKKHNYTSGYIGYFASGYCEQAYIDSAEPREKRIAELEKKNKSLTEQVCNVANNLLDNWCKNEEDYCPHLAKLEKENAELKAFKEKCKFNVSDIFKDIETENNLTKAKELLKQWLQTSKASSCDNINIVTDTEQFLSEVENDRNN